MKILVKNRQIQIMLLVNHCVNDIVLFIPIIILNTHKKRVELPLFRQFSSVAQSCLTLCNPMGYSMPGLPVHHQLPAFIQTHVHWVDDVIQPYHPVISFSSNLQSFSASGSFQMSQFFASGVQSIGDSASASVFSVNIQDWFPLGWTGWISLQSKGEKP